MGKGVSILLTYYGLPAKGNRPGSGGHAKITQTTQCTFELLRSSDNESDGNGSVANAMMGLSMYTNGPKISETAYHDSFGHKKWSIEMRAEHYASDTWEQDWFDDTVSYGVIGSTTHLSEDSTYTITDQVVNKAGSYAITKIAAPGGRRYANGMAFPDVSPQRYIYSIKANSDVDAEVNGYKPNDELLFRGRGLDAVNVHAQLSEEISSSPADDRVAMSSHGGSYVPIWRDPALISDFFESSKYKYHGTFCNNNELRAFWESIKTGGSNFYGPDSFANKSSSGGDYYGYFDWNLKVNGNLEHDCWQGQSTGESWFSSGINSSRNAFNGMQVLTTKSGMKESIVEQRLWCIDTTAHTVEDGITDGQRIGNWKNMYGLTPSEIIARYPVKEQLAYVKGMINDIIEARDEMNANPDYVSQAGQKTGWTDWYDLAAAIDMSRFPSSYLGPSATSAVVKWISSPGYNHQKGTLQAIQYDRAKFDRKDDAPAGPFAWYPGVGFKTGVTAVVNENEAVWTAWGTAEAPGPVQQELAGIITNLQDQYKYLAELQQYFEYRGALERAYIETMADMDDGQQTAGFGGGARVADEMASSYLAASIEANGEIIAGDDEEAKEAALQEAATAATTAQAYSDAGDVGDAFKSDYEGIPDVEAAEAAAKARFQDQCYLLARMGQLAAYNMVRLGKTADGETLDSYMSPYTLRRGNTGRKGGGGIYMVHGSPSTLVNGLVYNPNFSGPWDDDEEKSYGFDSMSPATLSKLLPMIRLYKVFPYEYGSGFEAGTPVELEVPFFNNILSSAQSAAGALGGGYPGGTSAAFGKGADAIEQAIFSDEGSRGVGAGIISFDWDFFGKNPYSSRRDIKAKLKLFFHDFNDILKARWARNPNDKRNYPFKYIDLITMTQYKKIKSPSADDATPINFKIKAVCGWAFPDTTAGWLEEQWMTPSEIEAVKNSFNSFYLTPTQHEWDIRDDNTVELTIDYIGSIYGVLSDAKADILMTSRRVRKQKQRDAIFAEFESLCPDDNESLKELKKQQQEEAENDMTEAYSALFQWLQFGGVEQYDNIYDTKNKDPATETKSGGIAKQKPHDVVVQRTLTQPTLLKLVVGIDDIISWKSAGPFGKQEDPAMSVKRDKDGMVIADPDLNSEKSRQNAGHGAIQVVDPENATHTRTDMSINTKATYEDDESDNVYRSGVGSWANQVGSGNTASHKNMRKNAFGNMEHDLDGTGLMIDLPTIHSAPKYDNSGDIFTNTTLTLAAQTGAVDENGAKITEFSLSKAVAPGQDENDTEYVEIDGEVTTNQMLAWTAGTYADDDPHSHEIFFFYLGDIVYAAYQIVAEAMKERGGHSAYKALLDNVSIILGPINIREPKTGELMQVNLADIPISYTFFLQWWMTNVSGRNLKSYALVDFVREVIKGMVVDVLEDSQTSCFASYPGLKVRLNNVSATGAQLDLDEADLLPDALDGRNNENAIQGWIFKQNSEIRKNASLPKNRLYLNLLTGKSKFKKQLPVLKTENSRTPYIPANKNTNFFIFYAEGMVTNDLKGDVDDDQEKGIPHFRIGSNKGLVKTIKFSRIDAKYMREGRWAATDKSGADQQFRQFKDIYNADVELFGNARLFPGQMVFIDPSGMSPHMGSPADEESMAFLMGIGGYYMITRVTNSVEAGKFVTNLHCTFTQNGSPIAQLDSQFEDPLVTTCTVADQYLKDPDEKTSGPGSSSGVTVERRRPDDGPVKETLDVIDQYEAGEIGGGEAIARGITGVGAELIEGTAIGDMLGVEDSWDGQN